jgi:hypothetical protein
MTSYCREDLSRDLAKMLPFTLLGVAITGFTSFSFDKILNHLLEIPALISNVFVYLGFIIVIELILRTLEVLFLVTGLLSKDESKQE